MSEYSSRSQDFKNFISSSIWADMVVDLQLQLEDVRDQLEDTGKTELEVSTLRGVAKCLREVLTLPERIMQNLLDDEQ